MAGSPLSLGMFSGALYYYTVTGDLVLTKAAPYGGSLLIWIAMALDTPSPSPRAPSLPSLGQPPLLLIPRLRLARREPWERRDLPNVREGSLGVVSLL